MKQTIYKQHGFTLVEVIVVLVIMLFVTTLVFTSISGGIKNMKLRTETKKLAASLRFTRDLAVTHGKPFVLEISADGRSYRVHPLRNRSSSSTSLKGKIATRLMSGITLPDNFSIKIVDEGNDRRRFEEPEEEAFPIIFYAKGTTTGSILSLGHTSGRRYDIDITPITGRIKVEGPFGQNE